MAIDERTRHRLYQKLEDKLGPEDAAVLMEHLPPVGWADVATKADLDHLREVNRLEHAELEARFGERLERALRRQTWAVMTSQAVVFIGLAGLILGRT